VAACIGLTTKKTFQDTGSTSKDRYFAILSRPEYRIKLWTTTVNMSWKDTNEDLEKLKKLPSITVGDALCDYPCFYNAVAKHVHILENYEDSPYDDTETHGQLMRISNQDKKRNDKSFY
jgi:hypothetical protein